MRLWSGIRIAAGWLRGLELHELDARHVGIVDVERPFAVTEPISGSSVVLRPCVRRRATVGLICWTANEK